MRRRRPAGLGPAVRRRNPDAFAVRSPWERRASPSCGTTGPPSRPRDPEGEARPRGARRVPFPRMGWATDVGSDTARQIAEIELSGLREPRTILVHQASRHLRPPRGAPAAAARGRPDAVPRPTVPERHRPGRGQGTVPSRADRTDHRVRRRPAGGLRGQLLVKAMPAILKNTRSAAGHRGAGLGVLADARVLALPAARPRHPVRGRPPGPAALRVDPGRRHRRRPEPGTDPWWPILAAWAARRPVVASHEAAVPSSSTITTASWSTRTRGASSGASSRCCSTWTSAARSPTGATRSYSTLRRERRRRADRGPYAGRFGLRARRGHSAIGPHHAAQEEAHSALPWRGGWVEAFFQESPGSQGL